jgi:hypothetical protein
MRVRKGRWRIALSLLLHRLLVIICSARLQIKTSDQFLAVVSRVVLFNYLNYLVGVTAYAIIVRGLVLRGDAREAEPLLLV